MSLPPLLGDVALPYFCDPAELPDTLPTFDEIEQAIQNLKPSAVLPAKRIVVVKSHFVVKYGKRIQKNEGHALLFLKRYKFIPAPKLYAMYHKDDKLYLIMSYMPGTPLGSVWNSLLESEKSDILMQLRSTFNQMRLILAPNIFSSVCGGPLPYHWFWWIKPEPAITGPFQTEEDLGQALALRSLRNHEFHGNENRSRLPEFFARHLPNVLRGHTFPLLATELRGGFGLALL